MNDYIGYPRGWFVVCFSDELDEGQTRAIDVLRRNVVRDVDELHLGNERQ